MVGSCPWKISGEHVSDEPLRARIVALLRARGVRTSKAAARLEEEIRLREERLRQTFRRYVSQAREYALRPKDPRARPAHLEIVFGGEGVEDAR